MHEHDDDSSTADAGQQGSGGGGGDKHVPEYDLVVPTPRGYEAVHALANQLGWTIPCLLDRAGPLLWRY